MTPTWEIREGDCMEAMAAMDEASVDAIVCDPPYGIGFMGKEWDGPAIAAAAAHDRATRRSLGPESASRPGRAQSRSSSAFGNEAVIAGPVRGGMDFQAWCESWAREALRVLKPGGYMVAAGGSRTYHRLVCAVEDAGFEVRDTICWLYGSGFPKSLDVSKAIDKAAGVEREVVGRNENYRDPEANAEHHDRWNGAVLSPNETAPATPEAERWDGWGTALKPAHEPIVVARKPLAGTVAGNVLEHGTGALNVDGCRIGASKDVPVSPRRAPQGPAYGELGNDPDTGGGFDPHLGRWPANVVLAHDDDCVLVGRREVRADGHFPAARGASGYGSAVEGSNGGGLKGQDALEERHLDGEAVERWACVPGCPVRMLDDQGGVLASGRPGTMRLGENTGAVYGAESRPPGTAMTGFGDRGGASRFFYCAKASSDERNIGGRNLHPTVKPVELMRWLVRLVTPPDGLILDPFVGSGTTGIAALREGFSFVGVEREPEYVEIARARIRGDAPLFNTPAEVAA